MLGEKIGETTGKVTGQRVLTGPTGCIQVETSYRATGKFLNVELNEVGSYLSVMREGGTYYGEGQGVLTGKDGDSCMWRGTGVGKPTKGGGVMYRGSLYFQTQSPKLARLNGTCTVFEYEVDESGNTHAQLWEWK